MSDNNVGLSFNTLREASLARLPQFKNSNGELVHKEPDVSDWSPAQWLQALTGEIGEYANFRKKYERGDIEYDEFKENASKELADVQSYLILLASRLDIDLGEATIAKFNEVSRRSKCSVMLSSDGKIQHVLHED